MASTDRTVTPSPKSDMIDRYTTELYVLCRGFEPLFPPRKGGMIDRYTNTAYGVMFLSTYNDFALTCSIVQWPSSRTTVSPNCDGRLQLNLSHDSLDIICTWNI